MAQKHYKQTNLTMSFSGQESQHATNGILTTYDHDYNVTRTMNRTRIGELLPNWKGVIRAGGNATTPLDASESTIDWTKASGTLEYICYKNLDNVGGESSTITAKASGLVNYYPPPVITSHAGNTASEWEADNQAITYLYKKIRQARSQGEGGIILGEFHKTIEMMVRPAASLQKSVEKYFLETKKILKGLSLTDRHGRKQPSRSITKTLADTYLEYTYGWQPLTADLQNAGIAAARIMHPEYEKSRFRCYGEHSKVSSMETVPFSTPAQIYFNKVTVKEGKIIVVYYGALQGTTKATELSSNAQRIVDLSGFNWSNFVPTVWEIIPYSFLIDYFTNIGDLLMAASTDTSTVAWLTKVVIKETTDKTSLNFDEAATSNRAHFSPRWYKFLGCSGSSGKYFTRYRTVSRGATTVPFLLPTLTVPGGKQWFNIGALLLGTASGRRWTQVI